MYTEISQSLSGLAATGNDFGFDKIYSRKIQSCLKPGDIFVGCSYSGNLPNIIEAICTANIAEVTTTGFSGWTGKLYKEAKIGIALPPCHRQMLEEVLLIFTHLNCKLVKLVCVPMIKPRIVSINHLYERRLKLWKTKPGVIEMAGSLWQLRLCH